MRRAFFQGKTCPDLGNSQAGLISGQREEHINCFFNRRKSSHISVYYESGSEFTNVRFLMDFRLPVKFFVNRKNKEPGRNPAARNSLLRKPELNRG